MKLSAVAFDLDNTLINFMLFKRRTAHAAAAAMVEQGLPITAEQAEARIFQIYEQKGIEYQKTFRDLVYSHHLSLNKAEKIQQAGILAYLKAKFEILKPYPDVPPTLNELRSKYKLAILTDAPRNKAWQRLLLTNLSNYFDIVITYDDTHTQKPAAEPFSLLSQKLTFSPEQILFVGDNMDRDIKGAHDAGMKTCHAKYGSILPQKTNAKADYEIERFGELLQITKSLD